MAREGQEVSLDGGEDVRGRPMLDGSQLLLEAPWEVVHLGVTMFREAVGAQQEDIAGPLTFADPSPMDVGAHPHMGLQTVTWLLDGELVHYDSLGYESLLRPGGVNVMTSGAAIAHAERTPTKNSGRLNGAQLWVALPKRERNMPALFQHVERVPFDEQRGGIVQVFAGSL